MLIYFILPAAALVLFYFVLFFRESLGHPRQFFFELLAAALILGSLFFFKETLDYLARRDYVAALLVMVIGVAVISVGKEMARLALVQRD
jgi:hypothetical protein